MHFDIHTILPFLSTKKIVLIGENHGVVENPYIVQSLVDEIRKSKKISFVGFEYPQFIEQDFLKAVSENTFDSIKDLEVTKMIEKDGRFSQYHFELLRYLYENNIKFIFFDSGRGTWDDRDKSMYENISTELSKHNENELAIIVAGNIHTTLKDLVLDQKPYKPLGTYFHSTEVLLVELKYHSGEFFNFQRKAFKESPVPSERLEKIDDNILFIHLDKVRATK